MQIIHSKRNDFVIITPAEAQTIYDRRHKNRPVNMSKVKKYAKAMEAGQWKPCTTLQFLDDRLEDGQHRMLACITSGVDFEGYVNYHDDSEQFSVYDTGKNRTNSDVLAIAGVKHYKMASSACAILEQVYSKNGIIRSTSGTSHIPTYEIEKVFMKYPDLEYSCSLFSGAKKFFKIPSASAVPLHFMLRKAEIGVPNSEGLESFMADKFFVDHLLKGFGLYENHPVATFRNYIQKCYAQEVKGTDRVTHQAMICGGIMVWNRFIRGQSMSRFVVPKSNHIPKILLPQV